MEWVETTAKTVEAAKEAALDRLGIAADECEFEVLDEPRPGLFGRTRGEGRVRARIKPTQVRPKQERKRRSSSKDRPKEKAADRSADRPSEESNGDASDETADRSTTSDRKSSNGRGKRSSNGRGNDRPSHDNNQEKTMSNDERNIERDEPSVDPQVVGEAAVAFMDGLVAAFGATGSSELTVEGTELDVRVNGEGLGLMVGPGGRTLNAVQDLVRVSAQRRLGDHETRLRIDVGGYRERRSAALQRFAADVAQSVRDSGEARALEPMTSADRKVIHDALNEEDGVTSHSEGDDPNRRIVVAPA